MFGEVTGQKRFWHFASLTLTFDVSRSEMYWGSRVAPSEHFGLEVDRTIWTDGPADGQNPKPQTDRPTSVAHKIIRSRWLKRCRVPVCPSVSLLHVC